MWMTGHGRVDMAGDSEWLVEDSEDEGALLPNELEGLLDNSRVTQASAIQTATFSAPPKTPDRARQSPDISNASLFTPPGDSYNVNAGRSPGQTADAPPKPRPRPKPRIRMKKPSAYPDESIQADNLEGPHTSHISELTTVWATTATRDSIQSASIMFPDISPIDADAYSSLDIADRAKMRSRKSQTGKQPVYSIPDDIIELTSDDELVLKPTKRQKQQAKSTKPKSRPRPKVKSKAMELSLPDSQCDDVASTEAPMAQMTTGGSSQAAASTMPTNPPTTPPQPQDTPPSPSPAANIRKRKRNHLAAISDEEEEIEIDKGLSKELSLPINEPPPFFASPTPPNLIPDSGIEMPESSKVVEERSGGAGKKQLTKRKTQAKVKKGKGKKGVVDEPAIEPTAISQNHSTGTLLGQIEVGGVPATSSRALSSKEPAKPSAKRKGKAKAIVPSDEEDEGTRPNAADPQNRGSETTSANAPPDVEQSVTPASKESLRPDKSKPPDRSSLSHATPAALHLSRATSIKPKGTAMSELIRRVNSQPSSPFPNANRPYSPLVKSSRMMLSRIAPLHPNRRTPPPPPPRPPPPKKSKKQIQLEEKIEEELVETVEGWTCMAEDERKQMMRARIDAELGYE
ncbi:hypothetical protein V8B97DRAFT_343476 [Scleroderma yunnanense]